MNKLYWEDYQHILEEIVSLNRGLSKMNSTSINVIYNPFRSITISFHLYDVDSYPRYHTLPNFKTEHEALTETKKLIIEIIDKIASKKDYSKRTSLFLKDNKREHLIE